MGMLTLAKGMGVLGLMLVNTNKSLEDILHTQPTMDNSKSMFAQFIQIGRQT